jgi:CO/xanthine dehydrogenase Mo-binding subunit
VEHQAFGKSVIRKEGRDKVTGASVYVDDFSLPNMIHGATIRSQCARGKIKDIVFEEGIPWDEFTIVQASDIPGDKLIHLIVADQPWLAYERINHPEEPVVLIAHPDKDMVIKARTMVRVIVEEEPAIHDIEESLSGKTVIWGQDNIQKQIEINKGDVGGVLAKAEQVIEGTYYTGAQEQLYIEPNGMVAVWDTKEGVTIYGSLQCPYYIHAELQPLFNLGPDQVRIIQMETGGGFGGKEEYPTIIAGHAALLAKKSGKPVKIIYDRAEDLVATTKRHPSRTKIRASVDRDGKLQAMDIDFALDGGAYATLSSVVLSRGAIHAAGPYHCPNVRVLARATATNCPPHGAFRGFGAPQSIFALERHMDKMAKVLGLTPEEFRRRNFLKKGQSTATGQIIRDEVDMDALLSESLKVADYHQRQKQHQDFNSKNKHIKRGIGFATFFHGAGFTGSGEKTLQSVVDVESTPEGVIRVLAASTEIGQGKSTIFAQIAADALGLAYDDIEIAQPDTKFVPDSGPTVASRTSMVVGGLVQRACKDLQSKLFESGMLNKDYKPEDFVLACQNFVKQNGELRGTAQYQQPKHINWDDKTYVGDAYATYAWASYVADVEVDLVTYETRIRDFVALQEAGHVLHPVMAKGQIEGGVAQAIGYAIYEKVNWDKGRMRNGSMTNYIMPSAEDLPEIRVVFVEQDSPYGPGRGVKGIGELPMDGAGPAILNAVENAIGISIPEIPMLPEDMMNAVMQDGGLN